MYDETIEVKNATEVDSSEDSDVKEGMARPPGRREFQKDRFELSESDSAEEPERFINDLPLQKNSPEKSQNITRMIEKKPPPPSRQPSKDSRSTTSKLSPNIIDSSDNSESDSNDLDEIGRGQLRSKSKSAVVIPAEGAYDPQKYANLKASPEIEELFQYIMRYTPQKIEIDYKLQPFIPDYIPAVGDIDPFIKVITPQCDPYGENLKQELVDKIEDLGLVILDEPAANQSDPALLHLHLRATSKSTSSAKQNMVVKKLLDTENNQKAIDRWIKDINDLHSSKPPPNVHYSKDMPDIDTLMEQWPETMENKLNEVGFPPANINCSLSQYVEIICNLFDIPLHPELGLNGKIQALHLLFTLYSEIQNSQLFKDQQNENKDN